jgi:hypothetical protein
VHTHPGSEAFLILAGEKSQRTPDGLTRMPAGRFLAGKEPMSQCRCPAVAAPTCIRW